jgi:hypothetical protein
MDFDIDATVAALVKAVRGQLTKGWNSVSTLVKQQSKMMAQQAEWIATSTASGSLKKDPVLRQMFVDMLADSVRQLAKDVAARTILTAEKVWNAAVAVLWGAINKVLASASGGLLPLPVL